MNLVVVLALGLAIGWLASRYIRDGHFGLVGDLAAGALGAVAGALLAGRLLPGGAPVGLIVQAGAALLGACALVALERALTVSNPLAARLGLQHPDTVGPLSEPLRQRLGAERGLGEGDAAALRVRQQRGGYGGRTVTYFQVFDPAGDAAKILHSGFVENDGQIVLNDN